MKDNNNQAAILKEIHKQLIARASKDDAFRGRLLSDPHAAVKEVSGATVPKHFALTAVEQPANGMLIVIPAKNSELSNTELESVAGGSKSGAQDFFGSIGGGAIKTITFGQVDLYSSDSPEGKAGNVIGSAIPGMLIP